MRGGAVLESADPALAAAVEDGLAVVEQRLREVVSSAHPLLDRASRHLADAGGKRVRPLLALLAAQLGDPAAPGVVDAAVVVELTHLATLYHDDVMDEADVRRGAPSANARWTNTVAILTGDFLFARASDLTAGLGVEATRIQSRTFARLVEGQISETAGPAEGEDPVGHHLQVLADKTASLFATSARLGALMAGAPAADVETVARYGEVVGTAFQLSTTSSTCCPRRGSPARPPGPTCARASGRCRCCSSWPASRTPATSGCASCWPATSTTTSASTRRCGCCARTRRWAPPGPG
jgi:heptaprenyl diphosphate synthase